MKNRLLLRLLGLSSVLLIAGCGRLVDYGRKTFFQADDREPDVTGARSYIRSTRVYDKLTTQALIDALWLTDDVRAVYADLHAKKHGKDRHERDEFLQEQLAVNDRVIEFYVLSYIPRARTEQMSLSQQDAPWSVWLEVGDATYEPTAVKTVELAPEYQYIFGETYGRVSFIFDDPTNRFRNVYLVQFATKDAAGEEILADACAMNLVFSSVDRTVHLIWPLVSQGESHA